MTWRSAVAFALTVLYATPAAAQDRSLCDGIFCPQSKAADFAPEFAPYVAPGKSWEDVKGQNVLIVKYYNRDGTVAATRTWPQTQYMKPVANLAGQIAFVGHGTPTIALYGLAPCARTGSFDFRGQTFTCATLWQNRLTSSLYGTQAILCRAYVDQLNKAIEEATCIRANEGFGPDRQIGGVVIDDSLVGLGVASLTRDASGRLLRPDLAKAAEQGAAIFKSVTN